MKHSYALMLLLAMLGSATAGETPESAVAKGQQALSAGDYTAAVACFTEALASQPNDGGIHYDLGRAYRAQGSDDRAAQHFYQAGLMFLTKGDKGGALRSYTMLRKAHARDLEQDLLGKLYPGIKNNRC